MFSLDKDKERLILIEKIKIGIEQSERGQIISESELEFEIEKWFDKT